MKRLGVKALSIAMSVVLAVGLCPGLAYADNVTSEQCVSGDLIASLSKEIAGGDRRAKAIDDMNTQALEVLAADGNRIEQVAISTGYYPVSAAIKSDGSLWMWGYNHSGQLGDGTTEERHEPVKVMDGVSRVEIDEECSAAIKSDGSLWMWGCNRNGQLGDGTTEERHAPVKVMDGVLKVGISGVSTAAIKSDGSLWAWGRNDNGQLGDGTTEERHEPVKVMDGVSEVSLRLSATSEVAYYSTARKSDGSLWMWGDNSFGQLGDGTTEERHEPVKVMDDVSHIEGLRKGSSFAVIKSDDSLWMWGDNRSGQLGDGTTEERHAPVKVMDGVSQVACGQAWHWRDRVAAVGSDGSLWMWGNNTFGELGDGTTEERHAPVKVMDGVSEVSLCLSNSFGRKDHSVAIKSDGSLWTWGCNSNGQLGDGTTEDRNSPTCIFRDGQWVAGCNDATNKDNLTIYSGAAAKAGFTDLAADAWYMKEGFKDDSGAVVATYLDYTIGRGLMSGYAGERAGQFGPDDPLSRGMAATIIYRMATGATADTTDNDVTTRFGDVPSGAWYAAAVKWCSEKGVVNGYQDGSGRFGPDDLVTREQLAAMIARYCKNVAGMAMAGEDVSRFPDGASIADWAREPAAFCAANGVITGKGDTGAFDPRGDATRCQMAKIIAVTARMAG